MITILKIKNILKTTLNCFLILLIVNMITSCEDNQLSDLLEEEVGDGDGDGGDGGDTGIVTYQNTAKAILDNACVRCHNATQANGGVRLHNFENASAVAESMRMIIRMTSTGNPMPPNGNLPDAIIQDIRDWIDDGILEN